MLYILKTPIGVLDTFYLNVVLKFAKMCQEGRKYIVGRAMFWLAICSYKPEFFPAFYKSFIIAVKTE